MRVRVLTVVVAAALAVAGLSGCRSNVGVAATIDGQQVSESQVGDYITAKAQPVQVQIASGETAAAPRAFVLETIIDNTLYPKILANTSLGLPSRGKIAQERESLLKGVSAPDLARKNGIRGFTDSFARLYVQSQTYLNILLLYRNNNVDLRSALKKTKVDVSVDPRYGKWSTTDLSILSDSPLSSLPGYIRLQPTQAASTTPPQ